MSFTKDGEIIVRRNTELIHWLVSINLLVEEGEEVAHDDED